jgi:hypothetical protein
MSATHTQDPTDEKAMAEDQAAFVDAMRKMATGEVPPSSPTVGYLLEKLKDTQAEIEEAQKKMLAAQETITSLRGRSLGVEQDLAWIFHNGDKAKE